MSIGQNPPEKVWFAVCDRLPGTKSRYGDPTLSRIFRRKIDAEEFSPRNGTNKRIYSAVAEWELYE